MRICRGAWWWMCWPSATWRLMSTTWGMSGAQDPIVWAFAQLSPLTLTLITGDNDFATILAYPSPHAGIIVVEVPDTMPPEQRKQLILRQLATMAGQSLADTLVILEPGHVRIRR